jgi:hypothetical protein
VTEQVVISTPPTTAEAPAAAAPPGRPEWLPEKFWDGNAETSTGKLAKAYGELEKKLSTAPKEGTPPVVEKTAETPVVDPAAPKADDAEKTLAAKGLSFDKYAEKFAKNGKLDDSDYAELEGREIPRTMVDAYIAGQTALAANTTATLFATAGGEEKYGEMIQWASANMTTADITAYNKTMDTGDVNAATLAIKGLRETFEAKNGTPPTRVLQGENTGGTVADVFGSWKQVSAAMGDPRYKTDPAYRQTVAEKLGRSKI